MGAVPNYVVKTLIFSLIFTFLFSFLTFAFIGNSFGSYSNMKGITPNDIGISGGWMNIDEQNLTYGGGWQPFDSKNMGGYEYEGFYESGTYGSHDIRLHDNIPGFLGLPHWADMYVDTYNYAYHYLNASDIIANFDYSKNYTKTYWRAYQDHDDKGWDVYAFYRDYNSSRNNITAALMDDGICNVIIAKQWSVKQAGFYDFAFWFGNMINPFSIGYGVSGIQIVALFMQLLTFINIVMLIILIKYLTSEWI
jgi:hypothetical protein